MIRRACLPVLVLACAGCSLGVGNGEGDRTGPMVVDPGGLGAAAGASAPWLVLDLVHGTVIPATAVAGYASGADYRDRFLVLRRCEPEGAHIGQSSALGRQADEALPANTGLAPFYIAVFETTRAQWRRLAGDAPWTALSPGVADGPDDLPAVGISYASALAALATWNAGRTGRLTLPQEAEWEAAVRAGTATLFPWGDDLDAERADAHAVTWDAGAPGGPAAVGGRAANRLGLFDGCGNVWELTAEGMVCGGSWADALVLARPANRAVIGPDTRHATVGLRLVYRP